MRNPTTTVRRIHGRRDSTLVMGDLRAVKRDPMAFWLSTGARGPIVKIRFGPLVRYLINDAEMARHVLQKNRRNYIKDQRLMRALEAGSGKVLVTSDGEEWLWRRCLMQPAFHRQQIARFEETILAETENYLREWRPGMTLDVSAAMKTLTMRIIGATMFNVDFSSDSATLHHAYSELGRAIIARVERLFRWPLLVPTQENRAFQHASRAISTALEAILRDRRNDPEPRHNLLEMLLAARLEDSDHRFTEAQLIHEMAAIVFAGHETTATSLTWTLCMLSQHPDVAAKVQDELTRVLADRRPTMADIENLPYLGQVINETMRLLPPLYVISRQSVAVDQLGDYELPAGVRALIHVLGIHRNPQYWSNPDTFDPDRFERIRMEQQHRFAFMPFLDGPRKCIGGPLAMTELQLILPMILQQFDLRPVSAVSATPEATVTLRPQGGLHMTAPSQALTLYSNSPVSSFHSRTPGVERGRPPPPVNGRPPGRTVTH